MISASILAFSSLFAQVQNPEPHTQKVIVKDGEIITEIGPEANYDTSKEISITIHTSDAHEILSGLDRENGVKVMGSVKMITIDEDGNEQHVEFDLDDMPEDFDFDVQGLLGEELDGLPKMLEMMRGQRGDFDIEIDRLHSDSELEGWGDEHDGAWMFGRSDKGNNMPHMMDMDDWMDMGMIMVPPMMMGKYRNPWSDNNSRNNDMVNEMHHRIDNLEDMVNEMHHRIDDLSSSLENIESMLHELLGRR